MRCSRRELFGMVAAAAFVPRMRKALQLPPAVVVATHPVLSVSVYAGVDPETLRETVRQIVEVWYDHPNYFVVVPPGVEITPIPGGSSVMVQKHRGPSWSEPVEMYKAGESWCPSGRRI